MPRTSRPRPRTGPSAPVAPASHPVAGANPRTVVAVIPARMGATRLPGKPLIDLCGKPMVQWVWEAARAATGIDRVLIATDSEEIVGVARRFGADSVLTSPACESGTDRVAEAVRGIACDTVINLQGDEPLLPPDVLATLVRGFHASGCPMGTLVTPVSDPDEIRNPGRAKVVRRTDGRALYFSRAAIPYDRDAVCPASVAKHIGVYIYTRAFLMEFAALPPSPLERIERLEQLRALENGHDIMTVTVDYDGHGVDTPEDAELARRSLMARIGTRS